MVKAYESEKSSRRYRDDREKERDSSKDHHRKRDHDHRHRSDRKSIENRSSDRYRSRDHSYDQEEFNQERHHEPRDRGDRDERVSGQVSVDRPLLKRKERSDSEERSDKGARRRREEKKEKRRFEVENSRGLDGTKREEKREDSQLEGGVKEENTQKSNGRRRRFGGRAKDDEIVSSNQDSSMEDGSALELLHMISNAGSDPSVTPDHLPPTKVCSISTPDENKIVSVTISDVPENSSTDGTSAAGKSGNLSVNAIVMKALQKQKELKEKLKKLPLNKVSNSAPDNAQQVGLQKDGSKSTSTSTLPAPTSVSAKPSTVAPVLRLDQYGNAIDEQGNIINWSKPTNLSTLKVNINKQKKDAFQILKPVLDVDLDSNPHFDERMGVNKEKLLRPKRMSFQFVEEGQWSKQAERIKFKSQFGEAQTKELRIKQALAKSKFGPNINPNLIKVAERITITKEKPEDPIPEVEWWDAPLLKSGKYGELTDSKIDEDNIKWEKMTIYVEHPQPIEPPAEPAPPPPQPLKLTPKEQKKMRTQRRIAKEKDRQEMIRQGLIEPPKSKVKISNLMKVLGSEATQDPTRMEMEVRAAAAAREQAHIDRNIARKRTPGEKKEKAERKLFEDRNNLETIVSVYKINDLSHPHTRSKVVRNAQENKLTGCVVIGENMTVVVVEGGGKATTRYAKLMMRRIIWAAAVAEEEGEKDDMDKPLNKCVRVWQGSMARPNFHKFSVHECCTEGAARKVFSDAGVDHYWDLAVNFMDDQV